MDKKLMLKQMAEFNQTMVSNFYQSLAFFQDQFGWIGNSAIDHSETHKAIEKWDKSFLEE